MTTSLAAACVALPTVSLPAAQADVVTPQVQTVELDGVDRGALADQAVPSEAAVSEAADDLAAGTAAGAAGTSDTEPLRTAVMTEEVETGEFGAVGVTWQPGEAPPAVAVRVREDSGWSDWFALPVIDGEGPDAGSAEAAGAREGTSPLLTTDADAVQVRVDTADGQAPEGLEASLIDAGDAPAAAAPAPAASASAAIAAPRIITRAQWGADESLAGPTSTNSTVKAVTLHHTASTNSYTEGQAAGQVRSFYAYHTKNLGWSDLGYNFLVDKYGNVYEGRKGSITRAVRGAHASGMNVDTMGVSSIGNYDTAQPTSALLTGVTNVTAWIMSRYGVDPTRSVTLTSSGGGSSRFSSGQRVTLPTFFAHRSSSYTACPGQYLYAKMATLRTGIASRLKGSGSTPTPTPTSTPTPTTKPTPKPTPSPVAGVDVQRLSGTDRYGTSVALGRKAFATSSEIVVASGAQASLVDGLVAAPFAYQRRAPLLLTRKDSLPGAVQSDVSRRAPESAWIIGSTKVVGTTVEKQLRALGVRKISRISGADRYGTAAAVAAKVNSPSGRAIVASGETRSLFDAAAVGGAAARAQRPILLTRGDRLPDAAADLLAARHYSSVHLLGGTVSTSRTVERGIQATGSAVYRLSGSDRYATAAKVAGAFGHTIGTDDVVVTSGVGANLADAMTAGAIGRVAVLTRPDSPPAVTTDFLRAVNPDRVYVAGSATAVSGAALAKISAAAAG